MRRFAGPWPLTAAVVTRWTNETARNILGTARAAFVYSPERHLLSIDVFFAARHMFLASSSADDDTHEKQEAVPVFARSHLLFILLGTIQRARFAA